MEKLAKIDYDNQKNLRFFVNQYKKAQEMIKETEAFYLSFLISKTSTTLDVLNNDHIKWIDFEPRLNRDVIYECAYFNEQYHYLSSKEVEDFLIKQKQKYNKYKEEGDFDGASIYIYSPLVSAVTSQIDSIKEEYNRLNQNLTIYAISCGKHPYYIVNYRKDDPQADILPYYLMPRLHNQDNTENKIKPIFKGLEDFQIYYNYIGDNDMSHSREVYKPEYEGIIGDKYAFMTDEEYKIYQKESWSSKKYKEIEQKAQNLQIECFAWLLKQVRTEDEIKEKYPTVYKYYLKKYNKQLKEVEDFKKRFKFLFDNGIFERFNKLKKECKKEVLLKDFLKDNIEYIPFQGLDINVYSVGWHTNNNDALNYQNKEIENGQLENWLKLYKNSEIPEYANPGSWNIASTPISLESFKTSDNPKKHFSDYDCFSYGGTRRTTSYNEDSLTNAIDKKKLYNYAEKSWKELIDMCKYIIISSADKTGKLNYSIPVKSSKFKYYLSNLNSRVLISKDYNTVYYVGSSEKDLYHYKIKYDEKNDQVICSRTDISEHKKYSWPSDAPIIRTTYELNIIFDCATGNLVKINGYSDSDEISCKRRY